MSSTVQHRHDTEANWTAADPVLDVGEVGYATDTGVVKIGDGSASWSALGPSLGLILAPPSWYTIFEVGGSCWLSLNTTSGALRYAGSNANPATVTSDVDNVPLFPFVASDYVVEGRTAEFRLAVTMATNNVAPGQAVTIQLKPLTSIGGITGSAITALAGAGVGNSVVINPSANAVNIAYSTAFAAPANESYYFGFSVGGVPAANHCTVISAALQVRYV